MSMRKELVVATLATALVASSFSASVQADQYSEQIFEENHVSGAAMVVDVLAVRPLMLGATVVGGVLFIASAPFALAGGSLHTTLHTLVGIPAENTFIRCLGCSPVQSQRLTADRKTEVATAKAAEESSPAK